MNRAERRRQKKISKKGGPKVSNNELLPEHQALVHKALNLALEHHTQGRLAEADKIYKQVLEMIPDQPDALHLLGVSAGQAGNYEEGINLISRVLSQHPNMADAHNNLGNIYKDSGQLEKAAESYRKAISLKPDYADAHNNYGFVLNALGQGERAEASFRKAIELVPEHGLAHKNLGDLLLDCDRIDAAIDIYRTALKLFPKDVDLLNNYGLALLKVDMFDEAQNMFRQVVSIAPDHFSANVYLGDLLKNAGDLDGAQAQYQKVLALTPSSAEETHAYGNILLQLGRASEALVYLERAVIEKPDFAEAHSNLGTTYDRLGDLDKALFCHQKASSIQPENAALQLNYGSTLKELGKLDEAVAAFRKAISLQPSFAEAHSYLGQTLLLKGDFQNGWEHYAWRNQFDTSPLKTNNVERFMWDGSPLNGKSIFVLPEQGNGDTIQFARFLPALAQGGGQVILGVPRSLTKLFNGFEGIDQLIESGSSLPQFDWCVPLLDLPRLLELEQETFPDACPYLKAPTALIEKWSERFSTDTNRKVGIVWRGNPQHPNDHRRSIPAEHFSELWRRPGLSFYSLQIGHTEAELALIKENGIHNLEQDLTDYAETAAVISTLDLVVTVDTSVAHLAGALGKETWVLLPFVPDWRWLVGRDDSPWYPGMRLFRQRTPGDWKDVIDRVSAEIEGSLANNAHGTPTP